MNSPRPTVGVENLESRRLLAAQAPYLGAPFLVGSAPATIEAEHYDIGGQGISYNDTTATNTAGAFRTGANEGVDTKLITTGQFRISDAYEGEWVEYSLDVQQAGDFRLELRVSNADPGAKLHVEIDGVDVTGQLTVPDTNSFNSFGTVGKDITLAAGARVLRLCFDVGAGPTRSVAGVDWLRLMPIAPEPQPEPDASATLTTTRASYIRDGSYADQNFGSASQLLVKRSANVGNTRESYLKFDVSSLAAGSVQSATLRLFGNTGNGSGSVGGGAHAVSSSDWTEGGLTWNNKPGSASAPLQARTVSGATGAWYDWDVTAAVQQALTNGQSSVTTAMKPTGTTDPWALFNSDEAGSNRPELSITTGTPSPPPPPPPSGQSSFKGSPFAVGDAAVTIQAEDYDLGGEAVAYHDTTSANIGGMYRTSESVDIKSHATGQFRISDAVAGEWLEYSIDVAKAAEYELEFRVSHSEPNSRFHAEIDGVNVTGSLTVPDTNSFNTFASVKKTVALTAGQHVLRLAFDANAANGYAAGLDWVKVTAVQQPPQSQSLVVSASALTVKEAGEARFSVNLSTAPASDVTVTVSRNAGGDPDLAVEKATLVFTPSNWNVAQQVVITAGADPDTADGSATFTIASSGLSSKTLVATEDDDDTTRQPGTYYVNLNGNDANAGTAPDHAWQSIAKINSMIFIPGDKILFRGEQSFNGSIFFNSSDSGTNASGALIAPITLGSYGTGNATISSGSSAGFFAQNNGGITLQNLNFRGAGLGTNTSDGIAFFNNAAGDVKQSGITVRGVTVSGYGKNGLGLGGFNGASGYRNVQITGSRFSENRDGVTVYGPAFNDAAPVYVNQTLRVANVLAYNNHGTSGVTNPTGNGIVFGSVAGGVIERSVAHHNGANNSSRTGPVGIWAYNADRITIQHNESYSNRRGTGGDGDGFDFDQNVSNSLMQYNYAHDNDGAGYLIYTGKANNLHDDNVVRYNVSERDGRMSGYGGVVIGGRVTDLEIYNNTIYFPSGGFGNNGAAVFITSIGDRIHVRNNILFTTGGARLINTPETVNELLFQRNSYWPGGGATAIGWGDVVYSSVSDWLRAKTAQERVDLDHNGSLDLAALTIDPGLTSPGNGGTIGDANNLAQLSAYKLRSGSGLRDVGLDLRARYGLHPGDQDFFGTTLMQGPGFDVGADEF